MLAWGSVGKQLFEALRMSMSENPQADEAAVHTHASHGPIHAICRNSGYQSVSAAIGPKWYPVQGQAPVAPSF